MQNCAQEFADFLGPGGYWTIDQQCHYTGEWPSNRADDYVSFSLKGIDPSTIGKTVDYEFPMSKCPMVPDTPPDAGANAGSGAGCDGGEGHPGEAGGSGSGGGLSCESTQGVAEQGLPQAGDPINTATGNKYIQEEDFNVDPWLTFRRFYNSDPSTPSTSMGTRWSHSFNRTLSRSSDTSGNVTVKVQRPNGMSETFRKIDDSSWIAATTNPDKLTEIDDASGQLVGYTLWVAALRHTEQYAFDGRLMSVRDNTGQTLNLTYSVAATDPSIAPSAGLLIGVTSPSGRQLSLVYDASARVRKLIQPEGAATTYGYDSVGNLVSVQYPDNRTRTYIYNESALTGGASLPSAMTGIGDEAGARFEETAFDSSGRAVSTQFAGGVGRVAIAYKDPGSADVSYPLGGTSHQNYANVQGLLRVQFVDSPCGECDQPYKSRSYDANGRPSTYVDFNGNVAFVTYDSNGLLTHEVTAKQANDIRTTTDTVWDGALRVPLLRTVKDNNGTVVSQVGWAYDASGKVTAACLMDPVLAPSYTCSPTSAVPTGVRRSVMTYCTAVNTTTCPLVGLPLKTDGPRTDVADTVSYAWYLTTDESGCATVGGVCHHLGDLKSTTDGAGLVTNYVSYDKAGRVTRIKDPNGVLTDYTYTARGWLATKTFRANSSGAVSALDATTTIAYDPTGTVHSVKDADGVTTTYTYDAAHRLTDVTDGLGARIHYTLDSAGNRTSEQVLSPTGAVVRSLGRTFNALGQLTALSDGLNRTVFSAGFTDSYDGNGNLVHSQDGLSVQQKRVYDGLNRLVSTLRDYQGTHSATANTQSVTSYDALDRVTGFSDPDGLNTTYDFDGLGNATGLHSPDTGTTTRGFDISGNPTQSVDAAHIASASAFDALGRLTTTTYADTTLNIAYHYDEADAVTGCTGNVGKGRLTRIVEGSGGIIYCYDRRGNVVKKQQTVGTTTTTTSYTWTPGNRLASMITANGTVISYARDAVGRIASVKATPLGGTATTVASNVTYQPFGQVASYKLGDGQTVTRTFDATGQLTDIASTAFSLHLRRDAMGNVVALGNAAGATTPAETYSYDSLYRLTGVQAGDGTAVEAYTYNKTGDRLSKVAPGMLTGSYTYQAGTHQLIGVGTTTRQVDARGNTTANVLASGTYGFGYNQRNRLTVVQDNGVTVGSYVLNALGQRVQKTAGGVATRFDYDEGSRLLSENAGTASRDYVWLDMLPVGLVDRAGSASTVNFVHADGLGSPRVVTSASGSVLWQWVYAGNPFGEKSPASASGYVLNLRFPGQYFDVESGLNYNINRDYEPATGRYIQSDPIGLLGGFSTFGYAFARPYNFIDPLGLSGILVINSSGSGDGILGSGGVSGHSWVSYTPDGGKTATYGTWGNNPQGLANGLEHNLELGRTGDATRAAQLNDAQEANFYGVVKQYESEGENAWGYFHPCSSFAADAWNSSTGESLSPNGPYSNPSSLKQSIIDANGGANHGSIGPTPPSPWP
jgi:RHS repeat-associated protein